MKKIAIFIVMLCLLCCPVSVYAAELSDTTASSGAVISAEVPSTHTLTVSADKAAVTFGGKTGDRFEVPRLIEFVLQISTDNGWKVIKVLLNDEDVTKAYADGKITLSGIYEDATLTILTEKIPVTPGGDPTSPQTGDNSHLSLWISLLFASGAALLISYSYMGYCKRRRKEK